MPRGHRSRATRPPSNSEVAIPDKLYFRIGEASRLTQTKPYVLRYWETEFPMLRPLKSKTGHRLYRRQDIETLLQIKCLLYDQGFTIQGARQQLADPKKTSAEQENLFRPTLDVMQLKAIKRELQSILTTLSRKC